MKKSLKILINVIVLILLVTIFAVGFMKGGSKKVSNMKATCEVSNHEVVAFIPNDAITLDEDGIYNLDIKWNFDSEPGFVTCCTITDEAGNMIDEFTGDIVDIKTIDLEFKKGTYFFDFSAFTTKEDFDEYAKDKTITGGVFDSYSDGTWDMEVNLAFNKVNTISSTYAFLGIITIPLAIVILCLTVSKKTDSSKSEYDERQLIARGEAAKYSLLTLGIYNALWLMAQISEINIPVINETVIGIGLSLAVLVHVTYSIWKDAYFALNENRKVLMIVFAIIAGINILILISYIVHGTLINNGKLGIGGLTIATCVMFVWIFSMLVAKSIKDKKEAE